MPYKTQATKAPRVNRKLIYLSVQAAISLLASAEIHAACMNYGGTITVVGSTGCINWSGGDMTLINSGTISSSSAPALTASALAGTLTNGGLLSGTSFAALENTSNSLVAVNNAAIISDTVGILNNGTILSLTNTSTGTITGMSSGIQNNTAITSLSNSGMITGSNGISNSGQIGTLTNTGSISGTSSAINSTGSIGTIANNGGTIAGAVVNSGSTLTITGGADSTFGTITGASGGIGSADIGLVTNTASSLVFGTGNQLLNSNINVGSHSVVLNTGSTVQVNNAISITGNYTQNSGSTLNIGVADGAVATGVVSTDSGYGRLLISGVATFNAGAGVSLKKLGAYNFANGQRFVVAQANTANANFNASGLNYSAQGFIGNLTGVSVVDSDDNTKTDLMVILGDYSPNNSATTPVAVASLAGLFRYGGTNAAMLDMFNAAAALGSVAASNHAGAQLSPTANTAAASRSAQTTTQSVFNVIASRVDTLRTGQVSGSGVSTGEGAGNGVFWGKAFGGEANQGNHGSSSGYRARYSGLLVGTDTAINDQWRIGGAFNYAHTSINERGDNAGSSARVESYGLTGYGSFTAENWYMNLFGGIVQQKYDTRRSIDFTGFSGVADGQFDGMQYVASAQVGYPIRLDAMTTLTPIAGLTYSRQKLDGHTETGSAAALHVNASSTSSVKSDLGAKLERTYKTSYGELMPSVRLSWRHEYRDTGIRSVANFAADTTGATSFSTKGAAPSDDTGVFVLGATLKRSQNLTLAAHYTLEAARSYTAQTADVQLRYEF